MKKLLFSGILVCISAFCLSQTEHSKINNTHAHHIGLSGGGVTGIGFSYRYWPSKWGVQITGIPILLENKSGSFTSIGLSALYTFKDSRIVDLYGFFGNHFTSYKQKFDYTDSNGNIIENSNKDNLFNIGAGFGLKFDFLESLNFNIQSGVGMFGITNKSSSPITTLTAELGLYYNL